MEVLIISILTVLLAGAIYFIGDLYRCIRAFEEMHQLDCEEIEHYKRIVKSKNKMIERLRG